MEKTIEIIVTNPTMWAVLILILVFYGIYQFAIVYIPQWQKESDDAKKERALIYTESNKAITKLIVEKLGGNDEKICHSLNILSDRIEDFDKRCEVRHGGNGQFEALKK